MCSRVLTVSRVTGVKLKEILKAESLPAHLRKVQRNPNEFAITCCHAGTCQLLADPDAEPLVIERLRNLGLKVELIEVPDSVDQITLQPMAAD